MRVGAYDVADELGRGGMGVVYRGHDARGHDVAIKLLLRSTQHTVEQFERERRLLAALGEGEGFVPLLDFGSTPQGPFIVMPFLAGGTLRSRLEEGPLELEPAVAVVLKLARAIGGAHAKGIVHRDLKPENVLFTEKGEPRIADLGLAKHFRHDVSGASQSVVLTRDGTIKGTAGYMAPEQLRSAAGAGPAADVFALGAILYEAVLGQPAFVGGSMLELIAMTESGRFTPPREVRRDLPRWLEQTIVRALAREPEDRFANGSELARALEERRASRSRAPLVLALFAVVSLLVVVATVSRPRDPAPAVPSPPAPTAPSAAPRPSSERDSLVEAAERLDGDALARAARDQAERVRRGDPALDAALSRAVEGARAKSPQRALGALETISRAGLSAGPLLTASVVSLLRASAKEIEAGRFELVLALLDVAGKLGVRFPDAPSGDAVADAFFKPLVAGAPTVPRAKWWFVLRAFVAVDIDLDIHHLELLPETRLLPRVRDELERFLETRVLEMRREASADQLITRLRDAGESAVLGPRCRGHALLLVGTHLPERQLLERVDLARKAVELDPTSFARRWSLGLRLVRAAREEPTAPKKEFLLEARDRFRQALAMIERHGLPAVHNAIPRSCEAGLQEVDAVFAELEGPR